LDKLCGGAKIKTGDIATIETIRAVQVEIGEKIISLSHHSYQVQTGRRIDRQTGRRQIIPGDVLGGGKF